MEDIFEKRDALEKEFEAGTDRASAVIAGAFLDELLGTLLQEFFVKDPASDKKIFDGIGPLATFSAKIEIAYRVGLISAKEYQTLNTIRSVRNDFAHEFGEISFGDQSIRARCKNIETPITMVIPNLVLPSKTGESPPLPEISKADSSDPRACFQETVMTLIPALWARVLEANQSRRSNPVDFVAPNEPFEQITHFLKSSLQRYQKLTEHAALPPKDKSEAETVLKKTQFLIRVNEFYTSQIKAAHEARFRQG